MFWWSWEILAQMFLLFILIDPRIYGLPGGILFGFLLFFGSMKTFFIKAKSKNVFAGSIKTFCIQFKSKKNVVSSQFYQNIKISSRVYQNFFHQSGKEKKSLGGSPCEVRGVRPTLGFSSFLKNTTVWPISWFYHFFAT